MTEDHDLARELEQRIRLGLNEEGFRRAAAVLNLPDERYSQNDIDRAWWGYQLAGSHQS